MYKAKVLLVFVLMAAIVMPIMAEKIKTCEYKDGVLTDLKLGYTMSIPENWKVKTFNETAEKPEVLRAFFIQKNYQVNQQAKDLDGDYTIPEIQIYARPLANTTPQDFMEELKNSVLKHNSGDNIISQLNLTLTGEYYSNQAVMLDSIPVLQAFFKRNWERHLQASSDDARYRQYGGLIVQKIHDVHEVFVFEHNGYLFVIQAFCEAEFYQQTASEFTKIIGSLDFVDSAPVEPK